MAGAGGLCAADRVQRKFFDSCKIGDVVDKRFKVLAKIAKGGYSEVYKVYDDVLKTEAALKVEEMDERRPNMEPTVSNRFLSKPCCPAYYAYGKFDVARSYTAIQLLGPNLEQLKSKCFRMPTRFSLTTAFRVAMQCVQAVEALHSIGFIHRDLNPKHFLIGADQEKEDLIYLIDFGLCRYFLMPDGKLRPARASKVGFRGSIKYASHNSHELKDLSRGDDMWSLFYTLYELTVGELPWNHVMDIEVVSCIKTAQSPEVLAKRAPPEFAPFAEHISSLSFTDTPNYTLIVDAFRNGFKRIGKSENDLFEWQLKDCRDLLHWNPT